MAAGRTLGAMTAGLSEREKMIRGELYSAADPELSASRARARLLLHRLNGGKPTEAAERASLLGELLARVGPGLILEPPFLCDYGWNIRIGANAYINFGCVILDCAAVRIGDDVNFGPGVHLYTATHPVDAAVRRAGLEVARPIDIGDGAWLGGGAIVLPGVSIGANSAIGAGAVVTRDVPSNVVAAGNPCRVLREL